MKLKLRITTILLLISFQFLAAQQKIINVLDNTTKQPISNVHLYLPNLEKGIDLKLQASALKLLANQGYDPEMGARPLRRTLQTEVEDKLAELLLKGELVAGKTLKIGVKAGQLKFDIV